MIELIKNDFQGLLDREHFDVVQLGSEEYVRNHRYSLSFHHAFETSFDDFDEVALKMARRIQRFRSVLRRHDVLFIRVAGEIEQMRDLQEWCDFRGISSRFLLLHEGPEFQKYFENGTIAGYRIPLRDDSRGERAWEGFDDVWDKIFAQYELLRS